MKFEQYAIVEFRNTEPYVYLFKADEKITMEAVIEYLESEQDFDDNRDSIVFVDRPYKYELKASNRLAID